MFLLYIMSCLCICSVENLLGCRLIQILSLIITCDITYVFSSLAYLIFHQVNYQSTWDTQIRLLEPKQNLSLLERKTHEKFFLYIFKWQVPWPRLRPLTYECFQGPYQFSFFFQRWSFISLSPCTDLHLY